MNSYRKTLVLASLFLTGLLVLWGLERAGVPTESQRRERAGRVLPQLLEVPETDIGQIEIARGDQILRFERKGPDAWQMTRPKDVAADAVMLETIVRNLKALRPSPDAGKLGVLGKEVGLDPPRAVVRVWKGPASSSSADASPLASLELGKILQDSCYVKAGGSSGVDVVEQKLVAALDRDAGDYREKNLVPIPTFQANRLSIRRGSMEVEAERAPSGRWHLTAPVAFPANSPKIESVLGACSSVRVFDPPKGFVADDATDLAPYGLDPPEATITIGSPSRPEAPIVLEVGKAVPDHPDQVYVRRADQDDVVAVSFRFLKELPERATDLRAQNVAEFVPAAVTDIEIDATGHRFRLHREGETWELRSPVAGRADTASVRSLIVQLAGLQTSEFLEESRVPNPQLDPPVMTVKLWPKVPFGVAGRGGAPDDSGSTDSNPPALSLRIGRHDALRKTVYGRIEGDDVVLALPDSFLKELPQNEYTYRDRKVLALGPESVRKLTIRRGGSDIVLEPDTSAQGPNRWRMLRPVESSADINAVTLLLTELSDLRAEDFVGHVPEDAARYGLNEPGLKVSWQTTAPTPSQGPAPVDGGAPGQSLSIGKPLPDRPGSFYASLEGRPFVFTVASPLVQAIAAEFHDTRVLSFDPEAVRRLVLRLPERTFGFSRRILPKGEPSDWSPEPGTDLEGIDLSRFHELINQLAQLKVARFAQYAGPIPREAGMAEPRLILEVHTADAPSPTRLRLGPTRGGFTLAATGNGAEGPVFFLPASAWEALLQSLGALPILPEDVFAP